MKDNEQIRKQVFNVLDTFENSQKNLDFFASIKDDVIKRTERPGDFKGFAIKDLAPMVQCGVDVQEKFEVSGPRRLVSQCRRAQRACWPPHCGFPA